MTDYLLCIIQLSIAQNESEWVGTRVAASGVVYHMVAFRKYVLVILSYSTFLADISNMPVVRLDG